MALLFCDSFSHYQLADASMKWSTLAMNAPNILPAYGLRPGAMALLAAGNANQLWSRTIPNTVTFIAGGWFRTGSVGNAGIIFAGTQSGTEHVSVRYTNTGAITFTRAGTVLATSTNVISVNTWYHIEVKCTIGDTGDSPSGRYEVRVNGTATGWIPDSGAGQDTRNGASQLINEFRIYTRGANDSSGGNHRFSDVYICDASGSVANDFLGPLRIAVLRPDGPGNHQDFVGNHADRFVNVSDFVMDGDTTFNQSDTPGDIDTFPLTTLPAGTVHAVQHVITARQDSGSGRQIRPITRIGSTDHQGTTVSTGASHQMFLEPRSVSPATSSAWTASEINGAEFGYERVS